MKGLGNLLKKYFVPHNGNDHKPHFLRHESMLVFFLVVMVLELGFLVQVFVVFDKTKFLASVLPGVLTALTNEERADNDAPPLTESALLDQAAQMKAEDMANKGYFAHTSPEGKSPWYWFSQVGYHYAAAGENLAVNFFESKDVAQAWMNSPTHRANIVKKEYTEIGIGVASGNYQGKNTVFVAQLFGKPAFAAPVENATLSPTTLPTPKGVGTPTVSVGATPKPVPAPTPTPVNPQPQPSPTPIQVAQAPSPVSVSTQVLGEERAASGALASLKSAGNSLKSFINKMLTSPRNSMTYAYGLIGTLVLIALVLVFLIAEKKHPAVIVRGFAMIAIILILSFVNWKLLDLNTEVPEEQLTASIIAS